MSETTLPQLVLEVSGQVVSTNLDAFKASARNFIDGINTDLQSGRLYEDQKNRYRQG